MLLLQRVEQRPWARHRTNSEVKQVCEGKQMRAFELKLLPEPISTQRQDHTSFAGVGGSSDLIFPCSDNTRQAGRAASVTAFHTLQQRPCSSSKCSHPNCPFTHGSMLFPLLPSGNETCAQQDFLKTAQKDPESNRARPEMYPPHPHCH